MFTVAPAPMLNVVPPENVPFGFRFRIIPWGNWGTLIVTPVPEVGSGASTPLPISSEDPAPLTVTAAPAAVNAVGRRQLQRRPATDIDRGAVSARQAGQAERSTTDVERSPRVVI